VGECLFCDAGGHWVSVSESCVVWIARQDVDLVEHSV
jgi:hypothetical protein